MAVIEIYFFYKGYSRKTEDITPINVRDIAEEVALALSVQKKNIKSPFWVSVSYQL